MIRKYVATYFPIIYCRRRTVVCRINLFELKTHDYRFGLKECKGLERKGSGVLNAMHRHVPENPVKTSKGKEQDHEDVAEHAGKRLLKDAY